MDKSLLRDLLPSLLIFCSIGFSVFFAVPLMRHRLREHFDIHFARIAKGRPMPTGDFFSLTFYLTVLAFIPLVALVYVASAILVFLTPFSLDLFVPYAVAFAGRCLLLSVVLVTAVVAGYKAWMASMVSSRMPPPAH